MIDCNLVDLWRRLTLCRSTTGLVDKQLGKYLSRRRTKREEKRIEGRQD
jgi:hypothetical protein